MSDESEIIQSVYAVTVDPERYDDLVVTWVEKLSTALFAYQDDPNNADSLALNEHVERATKVISLLAASRADEQPGALPEARAQLTDSFPEAQPVMRISSSGGFLAANASAQRAYGVTNTGRLQDLPFDTQAIRTLHALAAKLVRTRGEAASVPLVHAVRNDNHQTVYLSLAADPNDVKALFLTSSDIVWPEKLTTLMRDSFQLTSSECEVGKGLVEGLSLNSIAEHRNTSISTVRVHARSLFGKTSTTGQREFIRMAIGLAALYPDSDRSPVDSAASAVAENLVLPAKSDWQSFQLRDGRALPYAVVGPADGRVCLYVHDALFGPCLPRDLIAQALTANLRIVFIARQGWMGAPLLDANTNAFEQCAKDTRELMDYLGFKRVLLIGRVIGATYGYEIIRYDPSRYLGLLGVTPALPIGEREDINRMAPHHRLLTISIGSNLTLLKFVVRAGTAIYERFGAERFLRMLYRSTEQDMAVIETEEHFDALSAGLALGGGGAHHPFYHELKQRPSDAWNPALEMPVPFRALLGDKDPSARRRRAERMIELGVPLQIMLLPDCGELFIYTHPHVVIEQIESMLDELDSLRSVS